MHGDLYISYSYHPKLISVAYYMTDKYYQQDWLVLRITCTLIYKESH